MPAKKSVASKARIGRRPGVDSAGRKLPNTTAAVTVMPRLTERPQPPANLGDVGLATWNWLWDTATWLASSDKMTAALIAQLADRQAELLEHLRVDGYYTTGYKGQRRGSPLLSALAAVEHQMAALLAQCGLTPASRSQLGFVAAQTENKLDEMRRRRYGG